MVLSILLLQSRMQTLMCMPLPQPQCVKQRQLSRHRDVGDTYHSSHSCLLPVCTWLQVARRPLKAPPGRGGRLWEAVRKLCDSFRRSSCCPCCTPTSLPGCTCSRPGLPVLLILSMLQLHAAGLSGAVQCCDSKPCPNTLSHDST